MEGELNNLTSESVESTPLPLESIDNIHGSDSLSLGMLGVGDGITDDVLLTVMRTQQLVKEIYNDANHG